GIRRPASRGIPWSSPPSSRQSCRRRWWPCEPTRPVPESDPAWGNASRPAYARTPQASALTTRDKRRFAWSYPGLLITYGPRWNHLTSGEFHIGTRRDHRHVRLERGVRP